MNRLVVLTDNRTKAELIGDQLAPAFAVEFIHLGQMKDVTANQNLLIDVQLQDDSVFLELREWLSRRMHHHSLVFMVDPVSAIDSIRSAELGATDICQRPFDRTAVFSALLGDFDSLLLDTSKPPLRSFPAVAPALDALESIFAASRFGASLQLPVIHAANETVLEEIRSHGLESWLEVVRRHHSQTYQHSLIVVGVTAAFCSRLGFSGADQNHLTLGAMLHDLGKVHVPVAVLEKPGLLDAVEMEEMRKHPQLGFESLRNAPDVHDDILEIVHHHHEFLDGSGYPDRLPSSRIRDSVRIITVCDIFAALIEKRSYKPALPSEVAFAEMRRMGSKLDADILREFSFASELRFAA